MWLSRLLLAGLVLATACSDPGPTNPVTPEAADLATPALATAAIARGAMTNGANHTGSISAAGQTHTWTFAATQGNTLVVAIGKVSGVAAFAPWIRLVAPNGAVVGNEYGNAAAQIQVTAPSTGTYTVIVASADVGRAATGSYRLTLARAPGTFVVSTGDQGGAMTNGVTHTGSVAVGDLDMWRFTATQGNTIVVGMGEVSGAAAFAPWIRLVAPNGAVIGNEYGNAAAQIQVTAPSTGTYTVIVASADVGRAATGSYRLILARAPGTIVVAPGDQGGPMTNGATHTGSIAVGGLDPWTFTATQGNTIVVGMGEVSGVAAFAPWIRLVAPNGAIIGNEYGNAAAQIQVTAPSTGTYTVIVASADVGRAATGSYQLTLVRAPGTFVQSTGDQGGTLSRGVNYAGSITVGELDPWTFTATQGGAIAVSISEVSGVSAFAPWIRLVAPNGVIVGNAYGNASAQIQLTAPSTGTYTVIVGSADVGRAATGSYRLRRS